MLTREYTSQPIIKSLPVAEVNALTKAIEEKMVRLGNLQVEIVEMKEDLDDTGKLGVFTAVSSNAFRVAGGQPI